MNALSSRVRSAGARVCATTRSDATQADLERLGLVRQAADGTVRVGETVKVATGGHTRPYELTGIVSFGDVDSLGFASIAAWDVKTAQTLLDREGRYDSRIAPTHPGDHGHVERTACFPFEGRAERPQRRHVEERLR